MKKREIEINKSLDHVIGETREDITKKGNVEINIKFRIREMLQLIKNAGSIFYPRLLFSEP